MTATCIFCKILNKELPATKIYEDEFVLAFMDLYPMRPGHVLVIPKEHYVSVLDMSSALRSHVFEVSVAVARAQKASGLPCKAYNFFINDGAAANQHVPHVHAHVLPRSGGDLHKALFSFVSRYNNFFGMTVKRKKLEALALRISNNMPVSLSIDHTKPIK